MTIAPPRVKLPGVTLPAALPVPILRAAGTLPARTVSNPPPVELGRGGASPLPALLPEAQVFNTGFRAVPVPAGLAINTAAAAWYKLFSLGGTDEWEVALNAIQMQIGPTDNTGGGISGHGGAFVAWGNTLGTAAAIVVGTRLPGTLNTWTEGPPNVLGIHDDNAAASINPAAALGQGTQSRYLAVQTFAPGGLADSPPWVQNVSHIYGLSIGRIGAGNTLDVSLVVRPQAINGALGASYLAGLASVSMRCLALQTANPTTA